MDQDLRGAGATGPDSTTFLITLLRGRWQAKDSGVHADSYHSPRDTTCSLSTQPKPNSHLFTPHLASTLLNSSGPLVAPASSWLFKPISIPPRLVRTDTPKWVLRRGEVFRGEKKIRMFTNKTIESITRQLLEKKRAMLLRTKLSGMRKLIRGGELEKVKGFYRSRVNNMLIYSILVKMLRY